LLDEEVSPQPTAKMLPMTAKARSFLIVVLPFKNRSGANNAKSSDCPRFN
jgi:hypothetical protein